jgi:ABC-type amino acid transport system permease subunit
VRAPAAAYVEGFRATPLLLLLFFVFFGSARTPLQIGPVVAAVIALTLYNSAVVAEIVRAGIRSISRGIIEASQALGLSYLQSMRYVAVPLALRRMAPSLVSQLITLFKDTSLASVIGILELSRRGRVISDSPTYGNTVEVLVVVSALYFIPAYSLSLLAQHLERGARPGERPIGG